MEEFNLKLWKRQTFSFFFFIIVRDLQEKLSKALDKFTSQAIKNCYAKTSCIISNNSKLTSSSEEVI